MQNRTLLDNTLVHKNIQPQNEPIKHIANGVLVQLSKIAGGCVKCELYPVMMTGDVHPCQQVLGCKASTQAGAFFVYEK